MFLDITFFSELTIESVFVFAVLDTHDTLGFDRAPMEVLTREAFVLLVTSARARRFFVN